MTCSVCHGELAAVRVRRFPAAALALGWVLSIFGLAGVLAVTVLGYLFRPVPPEIVDVAAVEKEATLEKLGQFENVTPELIAEFAASGDVPDLLLERLDAETRGEVDLLVSDYRFKVRTARPPEPPRAWWQARWLWGAWAVLFLASAAGAALRSHKEIDRCPACGADLADDEALV
ncbi:MAG: hypothetical protein ACE148_15265 [Vicinamibacterales bacterium]